MENLDSFISFVNTEIPRRLGTSEDPLGVIPDKVVVTSGVGLGVKFVDLDSILPGRGLVTAERLPIEEDGTVILPQNPIGGILLNLALVYLNDGSALEVTGVSVRAGNIMVIPDDDYALLKDIAAAVTVSFIGDLESGPV